jgi:hypothetical protein
MLRSATSAFTRVFDALCGALLIRGPRLQNASVGPGSAEQRCTLYRARDKRVIRLARRNISSLAKAPPTGQEI